MTRIIPVLLLLSGPAMASVSCPASDQGRPLARSDGGSLYFGAPQNHMLLAPDRQARTMRESNVWLTPNAAQITMVCRYEGTTRALAMTLPAGTRSCVQDLGANTFECR